MKKAVIISGARQYVVSEGQELTVNFLGEEKNITFEPLLIIDGDTTTIGTPLVSGVKVEAEVIDPSHKGKKVTSIRYKAKKRVKTIRGHRQTLTTIKITTIA